MNRLLTDLYNEIAHGDEAHKIWLFDKMKDFDSRHSIVSDNQIDEWEKHFFDLGVREGQCKPKFSSVLYWLLLGFQVGILVELLLK